MWALHAWFPEKVGYYVSYLAGAFQMACHRLIPVSSVWLSASCSHFLSTLFGHIWPVMARSTRLYLIAHHSSSLLFCLYLPRPISTYIPPTPCSIFSSAHPHLLFTHPHLGQLFWYAQLIQFLTCAPVLVLNVCYSVDGVADDTQQPHISVIISKWVIISRETSNIFLTNFHSIWAWEPVLGQHSKSKD